ncbi:MAG: hypothetical protein CL569_05910 [Alphaproteobacteria bacterium]|nr:hypothetical protein [Alphaproteobacteria bacterium]
MKLIFVLFDSLNRNALTCYGGTHVKTPNFQRLADQSVVFDTHYVGSLPCIPARRFDPNRRHHAHTAEYVRHRYPRRGARPFADVDAHA